LQCIQRVKLMVVRVHTKQTKAANAKDLRPVDGPFDGAYSDPKHPGCPRNILHLKDQLFVDGNELKAVVEVTKANELLCLEHEHQTGQSCSSRCAIE